MKSFFTHSHNITRSVRGFTLVELMMTIAIFTSVMTIATGALFSAQAVNTKLQETQTILDEVNLSIQTLGREIRYGSSFYCTNSQSDATALTASTRKSCVYPNGNTVIVFKPTDTLKGSLDQAQDRIAYYISGGVLYKVEYPYGAASRTLQLTSQDINVDMLKFYVSGAENSTTDTDQPVITFIISGVTVPVEAKVTPIRFNIQTSVSARGLDN